MKAYKVLGTTDDVTACDLCGKPELKGTVVLMPLDVEGNEDGEACYFGTSCAAKAAGWTLKEVRAGIKAAKEAEVAAERARRIAEREAETKAYNAWVAETYGADVKGAIQTYGVAGLWAQFRAAQSAPVEEPAEELEVVETPSVEHRETLVRVGGVERVIRTEIGGKVRTTKHLETAHTKAVKAALVEMRRANLPTFEEAARAAEEAVKRIGRRWIEEEAAKRARNIVRRVERGTLHSHGTYDVAAMRKPHPPVRFTEAVPAYLVEVEPGHYATEEAAESLALF